MCIYEMCIDEMCMFTSSSRSLKEEKIGQWPFLSRIRLVLDMLQWIWLSRDRSSECPFSRECLNHGGQQY